MVTIKILDTGADRYHLEAPKPLILGRKYDHLAEQIEVIIPECEVNSKCTMIVARPYKVVDHIEVNGLVDIDENMSQYDSVSIGFSFSRKDGYTKNSEIITGRFSPALDPKSVVDMEPKQKINLDRIIYDAIVDVDWKEDEPNILIFKNVKGDITSEINLNDLGQQSGSSETDPTVPAWAKEENKPTYTYEEITEKPSLFSGSYNDLTDKPTIPSVEGLASETYVQNAISQKADKSEIPTTTSQLTNDSGFITAEDVTSLVNTSITGVLNTEV